MNDPAAWNNVGVLGRDRTYDLGKGITVKVARVNPLQAEPNRTLQVRNQARNITLKAPIDFGRCLSRQRSQLSLSPVPDKSVRSISVKKKKVKPLEAKEFARVQVKRDGSPKTPMIVDFSISNRKKGQANPNLIGAMGKENHLAPTLRTQKYPRTSRERDIAPKKLFAKRLRRKSECKLNPLADQSIASDFIDSDPRGLPTWNNSLLAPGESTAQFGHGGPCKQKPSEQLIQDLTAQWQNLAVRCESLEVAVHLQKRKVDELAVKEKETALEACKTEEKRLTKALFLINKVFSADLDEESQVRCAQVVEMLQTKIERLKGSYTAIEKTCHGSTGEGVQPEIPIAHSEVWEEVKNLNLFMDKCLGKKKQIESAFAQASGWFAELKYMSETVHDLSLRDNKMLQELLERVEDMETLLNDDQKACPNKYLDPSLATRDVRVDAQQVYEAQTAKILSEGFERLTTSIKNTKDSLGGVARAISEQAREVDEVDKERVVDDLDMLVSENIHKLLSFVLLLDKFSEGFENSLETTAFNIDCVRLLGSMIQQLIPSLSTLYDTVVLSLFDGTTFSSIQIIQPLLEEILGYVLMTISTGLMSEVTKLLHRPSTSVIPEAAQRAINLVSATADNFIYESFQADDLPRVYHYTTLQAGCLREKQRHYYRPLLELQAAVKRKLSVFYSTEVDVGQFANEIEKLIASRVTYALTMADELAKLREASKQAARDLSSLEKDFRRALEEIQVVKTLRDEQTSRYPSKDKSASVDKTRGRSSGYNRRSSTTSVAKASDTSVTKKSKDLIMTSLEEDLDDEKFDRLDDDAKREVESLRANLCSFQSKNPFYKKLIKLLESEFNLEHHSHDWIARAIDGLVVKKGTKLACGYSGSKKIDTLEVWRQMSSHKIVDLEKKGFNSRLMRYDSELECFVLFKPNKKAQKYGKWEASPSEVLENYSITVDESTKKTLWEQLGKPDTHMGGLSQKERNALKNCLLYSFEFRSKDSSHCFQVIIEEVRSALSFLVTQCAAGLA